MKKLKIFVLYSFIISFFIIQLDVNASTNIGEGLAVDIKVLEEKYKQQEKVLKEANNDLKNKEHLILDLEKRLTKIEIEKRKEQEILEIKLNNFDVKKNSIDNWYKSFDDWKTYVIWLIWIFGLILFVIGVKSKKDINDAIVEMNRGANIKIGEIRRENNSSLEQNIQNTASQINSIIRETELKILKLDYSIDSKIYDAFNNLIDENGNIVKPIKPDEEVPEATTNNIENPFGEDNE